MNYNNVVVKKPWGSEYLCYRNEYVAIWFLHIEKDKQTSMHCHPNKNTGFVLLDGKTKLSFLRNSIDMEGLDKIHIFRSRFHSTKAITDSFIFEIETPEDKHDLVRLDDAYGRAGTQYEGQQHHLPKDNTCFWIDEAKENPQQILFVHGCKVKHLLITNKNQLLNNKEEELFVITKGGIVTEKNEKVLWPGDVIDGKSLHRLASAFTFEQDTSIIYVSK